MEGLRLKAASISVVTNLAYWPVSRDNDCMDMLPFYDRLHEGEKDGDVTGAAWYAFQKEQLPREFWSTDMATAIERMALRGVGFYALIDFLRQRRRRRRPLDSSLPMQWRQYDLVTHMYEAEKDEYSELLLRIARLWEKAHEPPAKPTCFGRR